MLKAFLTEKGEEVLIVGSNEIAVPCVDNEGNDEYCVFKVQVPTGSRDGDAYDGYAMAEDYAMKQRDKAEKAAKAAEEKARKIARDEKMREQKRAAAASREGK
jgi:dihydrofolate reductase